MRPLDGTHRRCAQIMHGRDQKRHSYKLLQDFFGYVPRFILPYACALPDGGFQFHSKFSVLADQWLYGHRRLNISDRIECVCSGGYIWESTRSPAELTISRIAARRTPSQKIMRERPRSKRFNAVSLTKGRPLYKDRILIKTEESSTGLASLREGRGLSV